MSKFYFLLIKQDKRRPLGLYDVVLWDKTRTDLKKNQYGYQPWYSDETRSFTLPETLRLVGRKQNQQYVIWSGGRHFYVIHQSFWDIASQFKTNFRQVVPCEYTDKQHQLLSTEYLIGVTHQLPQDKAISHFFPDTHPLSFGFMQIGIQPDLEYDLFDIQGTSHQFTLIVSERLKQALEKANIVGLDFHNVDTMILLTRAELNSMEIHRLCRYQPV